MTAAALGPLPLVLRFRRVGPGVYDSADGRVTLYRIEGCTPAAWNAEWTIDYQNRLRDLDPDATLGSVAYGNIVDGAATFRDAKALAADAWPALHAKVAALEDAAALEEDDRESYAALADEMNDPDAGPWNEDDWDGEAVRGGKRYAAANGLHWPPGLGDYDRFYERSAAR